MASPCQYRMGVNSVGCPSKPFEARAAGLLEPAADLGEAQDDERDDQSADDKGHQAVSADQGIDLRRETEDARADDAVDCHRNEVPPADASD